VLHCCNVFLDRKQTEVASQTDLQSAIDRTSLRTKSAAVKFLEEHTYCGYPMQLISDGCSICEQSIYSPDGVSDIAVRVTCDDVTTDFMANQQGIGVFGGMVHSPAIRNPSTYVLFDITHSTNPTDCVTLLQRRSRSKGNRGLQIMTDRRSTRPNRGRSLLLPNVLKQLTYCVHFTSCPNDRKSILR
jgi:hypothetical protein